MPPDWPWGALAGAHRPAAGDLWAAAILGLTWGASWPEVTPPSMTRFPAGDDPIPATVPVTRSKPLGALGLLIRGCGRARTLICQRSCQPIGSPNAPNGLARRHDSGHRPCDPLQAVGRVGAAYPRLRARTHSDLPALVPTNRQPQRAQRLGATSRFRPPSPGPAPSRWARWGCLSAAWAWGLNKPRSFQGAGS